MAKAVFSNLFGNDFLVESMEKIISTAIEDGRSHGGDLFNLASAWSLEKRWRDPGDGYVRSRRLRTDVGRRRSTTSIGVTS